MGIRNMKLFNFVFLALSASASTLLAPVYEALAGQIITQAKSALGSVKTQLANNAQATTAIDMFETKLDSLSTSEVVDILQSIPIETILEGDLTADDMVVIFQDSAIFADMDFSGLSSELISSLDDSSLGSFNQSMDAFVEAADSLQNIFNSEITIYNFVAVFTDIVDAVPLLNDAFGFSSGTMDILTEILFYVSTISEKVIFLMESRSEYVYMYQNAILLTEREFEYRLKDSVDNLCNEDFDLMNLLIDVTKFTGTVVIDNWSAPFEQTLELWNVFIGNIPVLGDYPLPSTVVENIETQVQSAVDSIQGSLIELNVIVSLFKPQLNSVAQGLLC